MEPVKHQVYWDIKNQVWHRVWNRCWNQTYEDIRELVWCRVRDITDRPVKGPVEEQVGDQLIKSLTILL